MIDVVTFDPGLLFSRSKSRSCTSSLRISCSATDGETLQLHKYSLKHFLSSLICSRLTFNLIPGGRPPADLPRLARLPPWNCSCYGYSTQSSNRRRCFQTALKFMRSCNSESSVKNSCILHINAIFTWTDPLVSFPKHAKLNGL